MVHHASRELNVDGIHPNTSSDVSRPPRGSRYSTEKKEALREATGHMCEVCGGKGSYVHHDKPRSLGGMATTENAVVICGPCHVKADKLALNGVSIRQLLEFRLARTTRPEVVRRRPIG